MADTLMRLDVIPGWVTQYLLDVELGRSARGFSYLEPDAELRFGTQVITGRGHIKRFFKALVTPLIVKHQVKEFWDGSPIRMLRGDLLLAKRQLPSDVISSPFVEFLTVSPVMKVQEIAIVVGPNQAISGITSYSQT